MKFGGSGSGRCGEFILFFPSPAGPTPLISLFVVVLLHPLVLLPLRADHGGPLEGQMKMLMTSNTLSMTHFKPGVAVEALPDSFHYNKYIPLVFKLGVPELSLDTLRLNSSSFHCTSDIGTQVSPLCPVIYHLDRILAPIADSMNFAKNINTPTEGWSYFGKFSCDRIAPHFFHLSAHVEELHTYVDALRRLCPLASNLTPILKNMTMAAAAHVTLASDKFNALLQSSNNHKTSSATNIHNKKQELKNLFNPSKNKGDPYSSSSSSGGVDSGEMNQILLQMAGYVGFQSTYLLTKYVDTIRWNSAFSLCQSSRLSIGLVNPSWLKSALLPLKRVAEGRGYKLSLMVHEVLPHYYKLPLTDCILGIQPNKRTTLMIRTLVPVVKKDTKYTRFRLTKIPYLITEGSQKKICEIQGFDPKDDFLVEETLGVAGGSPIVTLAPSCTESELCYIPEQPRDLIVDPCVLGLLNGSVFHIRDYCSFDCFPIGGAAEEELLLPIIIRVANNQYSITGSSPPYRPINVWCNDKLNKTLEPNASNGVMQVILPCNCQLRFKSDIYPSTRPCDAPFEIHHLNSIPFKVFLQHPPGGGGVQDHEAAGGGGSGQSTTGGGGDYHRYAVGGDGGETPSPSSGSKPSASSIRDQVLKENSHSRWLDVQNIGENGDDESVSNYTPEGIAAGDEITPHQIIPANWIIPPPSNSKEDEILMGKQHPHPHPHPPGRVGGTGGGVGTQPPLPPPHTPPSSGSHGGQFTLIWILLILLCLSNGILIYVVTKNGLIEVGGLRRALASSPLGGWRGVRLPNWMRSSSSSSSSSSPLPRSRLREEESAQGTGGEGGVRGRRGGVINIPQFNLEESLEEQERRTTMANNAANNNRRPHNNNSSSSNNINPAYLEEWPSHLNQL